MKRFVLVLLATLIPVSSAYAIESPFTTKAPQTMNRTTLPKNPFATKNPFANSRAQKVMERLRGRKVKTNHEFTFNGDDSDMPYSKARERFKSTPAGRMTGTQDSSVFYRD